MGETGVGTEKVIRQDGPKARSMGLYCDIDSHCKGASEIISVLAP